MFGFLLFRGADGPCLSEPSLSAPCLHQPSLSAPSLYGPSLRGQKTASSFPKKSGLAVGVYRFKERKGRPWTGLAQCALLLLCVLLTACGGQRSAQDTQGISGTELPPSPAPLTPALPQGGVGEQADEIFDPALPDNVAVPSAVSIAPVWQPLAARLAADGLAGPQVDALLAQLAPVPTQSPMGRKMRELYRSRFMPKPPSTGSKPRPQYYKGVVTEKNAALCRQFIAEHKAYFDMAEARYGVPASVAVSLLFVETRLGKVLGDVPDNAFFTLASMAVSRTPESISAWLPKMPGYEKHLDWFATTMPKRADWAYKEVRALVRHMIDDRVPPAHLPSSIYGAVGLCQFMPSNIKAYGADGDGDGRVDLFTEPDAIASLSNYLYKHGWRAGVDRAKQHKLLMTYNRSTTYANTILALSDLVRKTPAANK